MAVFTKTMLKAEGATAAAARRFVAAALLDSGFPTACVDQAVLLTSEAVSSAIVHPGTDVQVAVVADLAMARVEVCDSHPTFAAVASADPQASSAMCLRVIENLAEAWGVEQLAEGKRVWFEVRS